MHSIKNTVVAVCLLGLSFLFYQASSKNDTDQTDLIPALDISDGLDGVSDLASQGMDQLKSNMPNGELPNLEFPNLEKSKDMATSAASKMADQFGEKAPQLKDQANGFVSNGFSNSQPTNPSAPSSPVASSPPARSFSANSTPANSGPTSLAPIPSSSQNSFGSAGNSFGTPTARQPSADMADRAARDQGLINELDNQFAGNSFEAPPNQKSPPVQQSGFQTQPINSAAPVNATDKLAPMQTQNGSEFQFASQPIPSSDSSFNRLASDSRTVDSGFDVKQATPDDSMSSKPSTDLQNVWPEVDRLIAAEKFRDALQLLSRQYRSGNVSGPQRQKLLGWLDALARKVIFSTEHHLSDVPYTVANETLTDIAQRWKVAPQLIYNINQQNISNPAVLNAGTQLKEVKGPFDAEISLEQKVMTLYLGDLYAGRFAIRVGVSGTPTPGTFRVLVKSANGHSWRDAQGQEYPPGSPSNGYGPNWIGLSGSLCIHAVDESATDGHRGCIGLNSKDAKDIFGILADGSTVKIAK